MKFVLSLLCVVALFGASQALFEIPFLIYTLPNATTSEAANTTSTEVKSLCWKTYLRLLSYYSELFTATSRQLVECISDGSKEALCVQKYEPIFEDIKAQFTVISQKLAICLKAD